MSTGASVYFGSAYNRMNKMIIKGKKPGNFKNIFAQKQLNLIDINLLRLFPSSYFNSDHEIWSYDKIYGRREYTIAKSNVLIHVWF